MTELTTVYDAFSGTLNFQINGRPLPGISRLTQFQKQPFAVWCRQLFEVVYDEINDDYSIVYVGRGCEAKMLALYSKGNRHCRSFTTRIPKISDSALVRLKKLHMLCQNGLMYRKQIVDIYVVSDFPESSVNMLFKKALPKLCYCIFKVHICPLSKWRSQKEPYFVLIDSDSQGTETAITEESIVENYIIKLSNHTEFRGIYGMSFIDEACDVDFSMVIREKLEFFLFPKILRNTMSSITLEPSHPQYLNFQVLDKVEPITMPVFPQSLELGQKKDIKIMTIPEGYPARDLVYRVSSEEILTINNNVLIGKGTGEVVVEAYYQGQSRVIASSRIVVVQRNRITSIKTLPDRMDLIVGDKTALRYNFEPKDADNSSTIRLMSMDGTIASVKENGEVLARKPGVTSLIVETDNKVRGLCKVVVFPVLQEIKVALSKDVIKLGEYCQVETTRVPSKASLDPLIYRVEPSEVAEYDAGSKIIVTKKTGNATLTVTDARKSVKAEVSFMVKKKGFFH